MKAPPPPHGLILFGLAALVAVVMPAQALQQCGDLANSPLAEPEWHARECYPLTRHAPPVERPLAAPTDTAYALDIGPISDDFFSHEIGDLSNRTVTGSLAGAFFGMDFDESATTLYALNNDTQELGTISLTGVFTPIGSSAPLANHTWTGLAIDPIDGKFYATSSDGTQSSFYSINPATGQPRWIATDPQWDVIIDISINCKGKVYGHEIVDDWIVEFDTTTGQPLPVGPTGIDANFAQGMDFDNDTGTLYAYIGQGGGGNQYGTIDLDTGEFTPLNINNPPGQFEGAMQTTCPPPEIFDDGFESGDTSAWSSSVP